MTQQVITHGVNIGSGAAGVSALGMVETLPPAPQTDFLKAIITILSLLPTILSLFKKKQK